MSNVYKILGQSAPSDTNNADLYTVPTSKSAVVSTLLVTNTSSTPANCTIYARQNGAPATKANAIIYNGEIGANDFKAITLGLTLAEGDIITVKSDTADSITFQAFGSEVA